MTDNRLCENSPAHLKALKLQSVLQAFKINEVLKIIPFGSGLINHTWKVTTAPKDYILQQINQQVFKQPSDIAYNIRLIASYLQNHVPDYIFVTPVAATNGSDLVHMGDDYFRLQPFVSNSFTKNIVETPEVAYEAAKQFGKFTALLAGFNAGKLKKTIEDFHNLPLRYRQFKHSIINGNKFRVSESKEWIDLLMKYSVIVTEYDQIKANTEFKIRVTHHDSKISNVLFDAANKGICVIDLDTVMPGYFISDVGDMVRTYVSPVSEEEGDLSRIQVREEFYRAVVEGYYSEMKEELTATEKTKFFYAGKFMIYMQALRFMTDYFNDDVYYGSGYETHNLVRAKNQLTLLQDLIHKKGVLQNMF